MTSEKENVPAAEEGVTVRKKAGIPSRVTKPKATPSGQSGPPGLSVLSLIIVHSPPAINRLSHSAATSH